MPRLVLMRVYLSTSDLGRFGGYYSVLDKENDCFELIPIPDRFIDWSRVPDHLNPFKVVGDCSGLEYVFFQPVEYRWVLHRDPRLDLGFYTDPRFYGVREGDVVLFVAGLAVYPSGFWGKKHYSIKEIKKMFLKVVKKGNIGIYVVGGIIVDKVIRIRDFSKGWIEALSIAPVLKYSPHYYHVNDYPVAIIGKSFMVYPPLKIMKTIPGRLAGPPSDLLVELIGREKAYAYARKNYRKSSGFIEVRRDVLDVIAGKTSIYYYHGF